MNQVVQGDDGSQFNLTIQDNKGDIVDLRTATSIEVAIKFRGTPTVKIATITDAMNGKCMVTLSDTDLQNVGNYEIQCTVYFQNNTKFTSLPQTFPVTKNINM